MLVRGKIGPENAPIGIEGVAAMGAALKSNKSLTSLSIGRRLLSLVLFFLN